MIATGIPIGCVNLRIVSRLATNQIQNLCSMITSGKIVAGNFEPAGSSHAQLIAPVAIECSIIASQFFSDVDVSSRNVSVFTGRHAGSIRVFRMIEKTCIVSAQLVQTRSRAFTNRPCDDVDARRRSFLRLLCSKRIRNANALERMADLVCLFALLFSDGV